MKHWRYLSPAGAIGLLLFATACSDEMHDTHCAPLIGGGSYCLQPSTAVAPFEVQQSIEAHFRGKNETMIAELEADATGMRFVGLTPFGHTLLQVNYNNYTASAIKLPDPRLQPAFLIALIQLALWPPDAVRAGLETPLRLEESADQRRIFDRNEVILTISYTGAQPPYQRIQMNIHGAAIELDIKTLQESGIGQVEFEK